MQGKKVSSIVIPKVQLLSVRGACNEVQFLKNQIQFIPKQFCVHVCVL